MGLQVEIRSGVNALKFFEPEGEVEFNVSRSIGIMSQLLMVVEAVFFFAQAE